MGSSCELIAPAIFPTPIFKGFESWFHFEVRLKAKTFHAQIVLETDCCLDGNSLALGLGESRQV